MKLKHQTRPIMVWSITDDVIEDHILLEHQFRDLAGAGFGGVAAYVRCSRYSWDDPMAVDAWRHITELCHKNGMSCWLGPDPRFVSHKLVNNLSGLEILLFGNAAKADVVPNTAEVNDGRFTIRCALSARHVHTLTDVAVTFHPVELAKVFAFRRGKTTLGENDIVDITPSARMFYNARDNYAEAFGLAPKGIGDGWSVISFFHVRTNHFDFSNREHLQQYEKMVGRLKTSGCSPDGIMWDEPGYTCQYGSLPYSSSIRKFYRAGAKAPLEPHLWKLAFEAEDSSHVDVRVSYYRSVQESISKAELGLRKAVRRIWGPTTILGIHDTWHFESADMCDMNHGSMNLWSTARAKSAGFVDLGAVNKLKDSNSPWYSNLAAMSVAVASLGKMNDHPAAYNNLWTVGDDDGQGWQKEVMQHCAQVMALFGTRWLSHAYGLVGTIGQERTFLGTPELPGYPEHSTWSAFPDWNIFLSEEIKKVGEALPTSNLLVLYPVETLYALADRRADNAAADIFNLTLFLLDHHFHIDVMATSEARNGHWQGKQFVLGKGKYDFVLHSYPTVIDGRLFQLLRKKRDQVLFLFSSPQLEPNGRSISSSAIPALSQLDDVLNHLISIPGLRSVHAPDRTWVTMTQLKHGTIVSLVPSRAGYSYRGEVTLKDRKIELPETDRLVRIIFPPRGHPKLL